MKHRTLFAITLCLLLLLGAAAPATAQDQDQAQAANRPPNIVLILSDDQAWDDYGFMGHPAIQTPSLDALADRSIVFEHGYVTSPLCRPSLASMVTGLYPFQHGVTGNDVDGMNNRAALSAIVTERFHQHPSMIRTLTEHGYLTHQSGKWWEGSYADGGFTHGMTHGDPERNGRHGDVGLNIGRQGMQPIEDFIDFAIGQDKPFFLWYAPFLPHTPHNPPARLLEHYTEAGRAEDVAKYFAMCEWFDETCGELFGMIDERGLTNNTVVLYICDNGWAARSTGDLPQQNQWGGFALRSKGSPYENGIRTPIMVSWPGTIEPARNPGFAQSIDLFPTACAVAGIETPEGLPGINLTDTQAVANRHTIYGTTNAIHNMDLDDVDGTLQYMWVVDGDWKLIVRYAGDNRTQYARVHDWDTAPVHLYNLADDPHEEHDLAGDNPQIVQRLRGLIEAWHPVDDALQLPGH